MRRRARWCIPLSLALSSWGCGPSIGDDEGTAGGSGAASTTDPSATSGIENANDDDACRELVPCAPFEVEITGECRAIAYAWDGIDCVSVTGCECTGPDCCHLAATYEECLAAVQATCDELPFCLTCPEGTTCFALCDHVGTVLDYWCEATTEDCGSQCVCEMAGYAGTSCEGAHPSAYACTY